MAVLTQQQLGKVTAVRAALLSKLPDLDGLINNLLSQGSIPRPHISNLENLRMHLICATREISALEAANK